MQTPQPSTVTVVIPSTTIQPTSEQLTTPQTGSSVAEITRQLSGLPIDDFFEESYKQLVLRSPEYVTAMGMSEAYGVRNDQLNDLSDAYLRETADLQVAILKLLRCYDRGRLHLESLRAVRLVTDTGIHAMRWSREEAKAYMNQALGDPSGRWSHEVDGYIVLPAQATGYKIGMLKILELCEMAMEALAEKFDIKEFHTVILGNGSMPLEILERVVQDYVDAKQTSD